jgi:CBS domain-containing protein
VLTVRDLMIPEPVTIGTDDTLRVAVRRLTSAGFSAAPVLDRGRAVGMLSLADVLAFAPISAAASGENAEPSGVFEDVTPWGADGRGDPAGWFHVLHARGASVDTARVGTTGSDPLDEHTAAEVMTPLGLHVGPLTLVTEAAAIMEKEGIHRLLVLDDRKPVGILTPWDIVRAVARGDLTPAAPGPSLVL